MLQRVFESILENAAIHNESPQVEISGQESGDRVEIAIADDGVGIPEENRDQIFGQAERNQLDHGEGFSLYFVDLVVDTYGGDIVVTENEMGGATFTISLPKAT
jgi:K+-sensing histidine kinase KdpD